MKITAEKTNIDRRINRNDILKFKKEKWSLPFSMSCLTQFVWYHALFRDSHDHDNTEILPIVFPYLRHVPAGALRRVTPKPRSYLADAYKAASNEVNASVD